jgi:hypothetical protein
MKGNGAPVRGKNGRGEALILAEKIQQGGAAAAAKDGEESDGFRFRFFFVFFTDVVKIAPLAWLKMKPIYRQSSFFGLQNWSLKFCVWPLILINSLGKN